MFFFFFKQKTAYELRISDWSSDVCSSDLRGVCPLIFTPLAADLVRGEYRHLGPQTADLGEYRLFVRWLDIGMEEGDRDRFDAVAAEMVEQARQRDRKSTRLNSSH